MSLLKTTVSPGATDDKAIGDTSKVGLIYVSCSTKVLPSCWQQTYQGCAFTHQFLFFVYQYWSVLLRKTDPIPTILMHRVYAWTDFTNRVNILSILVYVPAWRNNPEGLTSRLTATDPLNSSYLRKHMFEKHYASSPICFIPFALLWIAYLNNALDDHSMTVPSAQSNSFYEGESSAEVTGSEWLWHTRLLCN